MKRKRIPKIGITGGIGAGKTIISEIFIRLGVPVYYADDRAKLLMQTNEELISKIKDHFGDEAYVDGKLNRNYLSNHIFNDPEKLKAMNSLVHPAVREDYHHWHELQSNAPYTIKEAALLFESGSYIELDKIILIVAPLNIRIERVLLRDPHRNKKDILEIISNQMDEMEKKDKADYVIDNGINKMVIPQVLSVHKKIRELSIY